MAGALQPAHPWGGRDLWKPAERVEEGNHDLREQRKFCKAKEMLV